MPYLKKLFAKRALLERFGGDNWYFWVGILIVIALIVLLVILIRRRRARGRHLKADHA